MLIGEVSEQSGISTRMLRHYDRIGLVSPTERAPSGYRRYSEEDVRRLFYVEGLRSLGLSLSDIAGVLDDLSFSPASMIDQLIARTHDRRAREEELLRRLGQVQASGPTAWSDVLRTIGLVRGLDNSDPSTRQRLVLSLTGAVERDVAAVAEAALNETDPHVAGALNWTLARIGDGAVPILAEALHSPLADRRHRAVAALVKIGSERAHTVLSAALRHPDPVVSGRAALACGARGEVTAIRTLIDLVVDGRDDVEAAEVLGVLASQYGQRDAIAGNIARRLPDATDAARWRLTSALADVPGPLAEATLTSLVDDPDRRVALTASYLLRRRHPDT